MAMKQYALSELTARPGRQPVMRLLYYSSQWLRYAKTVCVDEEAGEARISIPVMAGLKLAADLWDSFVYRGMSWDVMIVEPHYTAAAKTPKVNFITLQLTVRENKSDNKLEIRIKR
jgi:hypothetical protein